jgi:hypothetical protein
VSVKVTRRKVRDLPDYKSAYVKAGVLAGATYPAETIKPADGSKPYQDPRAGKPVAMFAAALHYGFKNVPPRPFIAQPAAQYGAEWAKMVADDLRAGVSVNRALGTAGVAMRDAIKETILQWPGDNSPKWAAKKGFNHGLVMTAHLSNSIEWELVEP